MPFIRNLVVKGKKIQNVKLSTKRKSFQNIKSGTKRNLRKEKELCERRRMDGMKEKKQYRISITQFKKITNIFKPMCIQNMSNYDFFKNVRPFCIGMNILTC